jgi:hypothetical protein
MKEFNELISILSINCHKCLDISLLWKYGEDYKDEKKRFIIVSCDHCCRGTFISYSPKNNLIINNVPIFNIYDDLYKDNDNYIYTSSRMPTLRRLITLKMNIQYKYDEI